MVGERSASRGTDVTHWAYMHLFPLFSGQKFLCSEVIAPIRSEIDDISLYIINFEDLTNPATVEPLAAPRLSKCESEKLRMRLSANLLSWRTIIALSVDRARASFRTKFGNIGFRDRGLRLAGYLTPPSDVTQEEEEATSRWTISEFGATNTFQCWDFSAIHRVPCLEKIESGKVWTPSSAVGASTSAIRPSEQEIFRETPNRGHFRLASPKVTRSIDFISFCTLA